MGAEGVSDFTNQGDAHTEEATAVGFAVWSRAGLKAQQPTMEPSRLCSKSLVTTTAEQLRERLLSGTWKRGQQLPSEPVLAKTIGVSRSTLREALRSLEEEGLILRRHGLGSFVTVSSGQIVAGLEHLESYVGMVRRHGFRAEDRVLQIDGCVIENEVAELLGLPPLSLGWNIKSIILADGLPVIYCDDVVPTWLVPERSTMEQRWAKPLLDFLREDLDAYPRYVFHTLGAAVAEGEVMAQLGCQGTEPLVTLRGLGFGNSERPIYLTRTYIRSRYIAFTLIRR